MACRHGYIQVYIHIYTHTHVCVDINGIQNLHRVVQGSIRTMDKMMVNQLGICNLMLVLHYAVRGMRDDDPVICWLIPPSGTVDLTPSYPLEGRAWWKSIPIRTLNRKLHIAIKTHTHDQPTPPPPSMIIIKVHRSRSVHRPSSRRPILNPNTGFQRRCPRWDLTIISEHVQLGFSYRSNTWIRNETRA